MADTPLDVARAVAGSMNAASAALQRATKKALQTAGSAARKELNQRAAEVPGGDRRFSNMSGYNHGGRLAVSVRQRPGAVFVMSKGPWKLAEEGANPHRIGRGLHPGTRGTQGRESWTRGRESIFSDVGRTFPEEVGDAVEQAFGG